MMLCWLRVSIKHGVSPQNLQCRALSAGSRAENAEERLVNYLLGPERYNKLIRPAVNKSQQVTISIQVSLSQLISVVSALTCKNTYTFCTHRW